MKIKELIKPLDFLRYPNLKDFEVKGISCNSKLVGRDFVFVAIKGNRQDGNSFIKEALDKGAGAVVVQDIMVQDSGRVPFIAVKDARKALARLAADFFGKPSLRIKTTGITGTNGKTTVSYLIETLLEAAGFLPAVIGTINYRFKGKVIPSKNTTPGPIELQGMLADMLKEGVDYVVMEVSSHALAQDRTEGINFHSAIFTNLTQDHLDYHKTKRNYFLSKAKLFKEMSSSSFAVINSDDKYGVRLKKLTPARIITYGLSSGAKVCAKDIKYGWKTTRFNLASPLGEIDISAPLIGRHNLYNILAAAAWAEEEGISLNVIKSAIENFSFVPGRLERIDSPEKFSVFVDYAHTEDALKNIIEALRVLVKRKIIVVFGCGGERDRSKRPKMGEVVSGLADYAVITNDNPRSEDPEEIIKDIKRGIRKTNFCVIPERAEAIRKSLSLAKPGDIVLVAGKGHENYQILKDRVIPFDDCKVIRECLNLMN